MPWWLFGLGLVGLKVLVDLFAEPEQRGSNRPTVNNIPSGGSMSQWGTSGSSGSLPSERGGRRRRR